MILRMQGRRDDVPSGTGECATDEQGAAPGFDPTQADPRAVSGEPGRGQLLSEIVMKGERRGDTYVWVIDRERTFVPNSMNSEEVDF